jgi:hypothetical protein
VNDSCVPQAKIDEHFKIADIRKMYRQFVVKDERRVEEDREFDRWATEHLDQAAARAIDAIDHEAEDELEHWLEKLREAGTKDHRNALAYNAGKRLKRFIKAGRLDEARVMREVNAVLDAWSATT